MIDPIPLQEPQHVPNKVPVLNISNLPHIDDDDVINIQLPYDPDLHTELNL